MMAVVISTRSIGMWNASNGSSSVIGIGTSINAESINELIVAWGKEKVRTNG
jgi:hypothetical protein